MQLDYLMTLTVISFADYLGGGVRFGFLMLSATPREPSETAPILDRFNVAQPLDKNTS